MSGFLPADVGRDISSGAGYGTITGYTSPTIVTVDVKQAFDATKFNSGSWTILGTPQTTCTPSVAAPVGAFVTLSLAADGWRPTDVGKFVQINGGLVRLTLVTSATLAGGVIEAELSAPVAAPPLAWTLEGSVWGGSNGWPGAGTLHEQRLWLGGSLGFPSTLWASVIAEYFNFLLGTFDDDAIAYIIGSGEYNAIRHLSEATGLLALTYGSEFSIRGGQEKAITPTNLQVKSQSVYGSSAVAPVRVGNEIYMAQRAGRKIRALSPNQFDSENYVAPDMSVLAEHVTEGGVVDMCFQQEPLGVLHVVRGDGQIGTCTIDRDQDVIAWARQRTQGGFESACSVPTADGETVFAVVNRIINGVSTRYIERFDPTLETDCAITGSSTAGALTWTGLGHLEGRRVTVKGDGVALADRTVVAGSITVERLVYKIEIGLQFISTIVTLPADLGTAEGSSLGGNSSVHEVIVRLHKSTGLKINYQEVAGFRQYGLAVLDKPPPVKTGLVKAGNLGWAAGGVQTIIQRTLPYKMHVLSVITKMTVNSG